MAKNIVLIGLMGSGKTTVARLLSEKSGKNVSDTDQIIELGAQKTINEIFEFHGESFFRKFEAKIIEKLSSQSDEIISTGGGSVENVENINNLKQNGVIFYLYAPADMLFKRIKSSHNRPLLQNPKPLDTLKGLLIKREKFYEMADFKIDTSRMNPEKVADKIIEKYNEHING